MKAITNDQETQSEDSEKLYDRWDEEEGYESNNEVDLN